MKLLWINCNQFETLKHFEQAEIHGDDIVHPLAVPTWGSFHACFNKGLVAKVDGVFCLTDRGREALNAYPNPITLEEEAHEDRQGALAM